MAINDSKKDPKIMQKRAVFCLAMRDAEFHLENTVLNGQCFNWWKHTRSDGDLPTYRGIYSKYCIELERLS